MKRTIWLLCIGMVASTSWAQECLEGLFLQQRGYPIEIEVDGERLLVADGAGFTVVDVSDPLSPRTTSMAFSENAASLAIERVDDQRVALLTREDLQIVDVTGSNPLLIASMEVTGTNVHLLGSSLIIAGETLTRVTFGGGVVEPNKTVSLPGRPIASAVVGERLLVSVPGIGTYLFDGNLNEIARIGIVATSIDGADGTLFLGNGDGVFAVDLGDPAQPRILQHLSEGTNGTHLVVSGDRLYASGGDRTLLVIDIGDPEDMKPLHELPVDFDVIATDDRFLYSYAFELDRFGVRVEQPGDYLTIRDLQSDELPIVGSLSGAMGPVSGVATDGHTVWIADPPFVRAIDLSTRREIWNLRIDEPFDRVRFESGWILLYGRTWVHMIDPDPIDPRLHAKWPTLGIPGGGVTFSGEWLIEANRASGFHVLDVSNPPEITQRGGIVNDGRGQWRHVVGIPGYVYGAVNTGVKVVDLTGNPADVQVVNFLTFGGPTDIDVYYHENRPYLLVPDGGQLHILDLSVPTIPLKIAAIEVGTAFEIAVSDSSVWILGKERTITGIDMTNPAAPTKIGVVDGMREGISIAAGGDVVVAADRWALWVRRLSGAEGVGAPVLTQIDSGGGSARILWEGVPALETEIQFSLREDFATIERSWVTSVGVLDVGRASETGWIRARFRSRCSVGEWSSALRIDPRSPRRRPVSSVTGG